MRIFLLENATVGSSCKAIMCGPDASNGVVSDRAINMITPTGSKLVVRPVGQSSFSVTETASASETVDLHDTVVREAQNRIDLEIVYCSDSSDVPAFGFLDSEGFSLVDVS